MTQESRKTAGFLLHLVPQSMMNVMLATSAAGIKVPWFTAGVGIGVPVSIAAASSIFRNQRLFSLAILLGGLSCGILADHLSRTVFSHLSEAFTCYDVLMKGAGPACLILVTLCRGVRDEPSVAVKPAALAALAALVIEPVFTAFVMRNLYLSGFLPESGLTIPGAGLLAWGGHRRKAAAAAVAAASAEISRARWLAGVAQVTLWAASMRALGKMGLRVSRASGRTLLTLSSYLAALKILASGKRGNAVWFRREVIEKEVGECVRDVAPNDPVTEVGNERASGILGSLYERLSKSHRPVRADSHLLEVSNPTFERGEVTVRGLYCTGLDTALSGRWVAGPACHVSGRGDGADGGGGGGLPGGDSRPFYVSLAIGNIMARTSVRTGFSPTFTEVFPLGINCPIVGGVLTIQVIDSFETGRSGRGDRVVGEVRLPIDSADLVPGSLAETTVGGPTYHLTGEWQLHGIVGPLGPAARVGAKVIVKPPPTAESAAGKFRRRESVGWYAR